MLTSGNHNMTIKNDSPKNHDSIPNLLNSQHFGRQVMAFLGREKELLLREGCGYVPLKEFSEYPDSIRVICNIVKDLGTLLYCLGTCLRRFETN